MKCIFCKRNVMEISILTGACNKCEKKPNVKRELKRAINGLNNIIREEVKQ